MKVEIKKILFDKKSDFQKIIIVDTKKFGKCLVIDEIIQTAETDHAVYDYELLKMLKKSDQKLLILGGGDGYVAQMALEINPKLSVEVIDLDLEVVKSCQIKLKQKIFYDSRVNLCVSDVFHYLKFTVNEMNGKFNGIVCDLTDAPIGRRKKKDFEKFYSDIIKLSIKNLKSDGWISIQAGASRTMSHYINAVDVIGKLLKKHFKNIKRSDVFIPSYGESCAFLFAKKR